MRIINKSKYKVFVLIAIMFLMSTSIICAQNKDKQNIEISFLTGVQNKSHISVN